MEIILLCSSGLPITHCVAFLVSVDLEKKAAPVPLVTPPPSCSSFGKQGAVRQVQFFSIVMVLRLVVPDYV